MPQRHGRTTYQLPRRPSASRAVAQTRDEAVGPGRRSVVWGVLVVAMTAVGGVLYPFASRGETGLTGQSIAPLRSLSQPASVERVFDARVPLAEERWDAIVIHHSGSPVCTAGSIDERHRAAGLTQLGYHFVIGNGRRMGDGELHIGNRWVEQAPGAHVAGEAGLTLNHTAIGVCLVGNGDRRPFTRAQLQRLIELISHLRERLDISADRVFTHAEVAETTSPGRLFPESEVRGYLAEW